ncbi:MAG TPA: cache type 2 domain-containing protein [Desulfuromonadales bacterium]|nr:cache type 2 domain-containing protein [Desulfuromonadales bacterium]
MKKLSIILLAALVTGLFGFSGIACASGKDDAKSLVKHAAAFVKYQGKGKALAEISKPRGQFDKGELYVFAYDLQGVMVAHPKNPALIGKNLIDVPDNDGKLFRRDIVEKAKTKGSGWVDYMYLNPETNEVEHKTTYLQKMGDIIICAGAYKEYSHDGD